MAFPKVGLEAVFKDAAFRKAVSSYNTSLTDMGRKSESAAHRIGVAMMGLGRIAGAGLGVVAVAGLGASAALGKLAVDAMPLEGIAEGFRHTADDAEKMLAALQRGSGGMVKNAALMRNYNEAAQLVGKTFADQLPDALVLLRKVSYSTNKDLQQLLDDTTKAIGRQSIVIADNAGVQMTQEEATARAVAMFGVEEEQLTKLQRQLGFASVYMERLEENTRNLADPVGKSSQKWAAFLVDLQNTRDEMGIRLLPTLSKLLTTAQAAADRYLPMMVAGFEEHVIPAVERAGQVVGDFFAAIEEGKTPTEALKLALDGLVPASTIDALGSAVTLIGNLADKAAGAVATFAALDANTRNWYLALGAALIILPKVYEAALALYGVAKGIAATGFWKGLGVAGALFAEGSTAADAMTASLLETEAEVRKSATGWDDYRAQMIAATRQWMEWQHVSHEALSDTEIAQIAVSRGLMQMPGQFMALGDAADTAGGIASESMWGISDAADEAAAAMERAIAEARRLDAAYSDQDKAADRAAAANGRVARATTEVGASAAKAAPQVGDLSSALTTLNPAAQAAGAAVTQWQSAIDGVNGALTANSDRMKRAQDRLGEMQGKLQGLQDELAKAQAALDDFAHPRLAGQSELEMQIGAVQEQLQRMELARTMRVPLEDIVAEYPLLTEGAEDYLATLPKTSWGLEKILKQLQLVEGLSFDEKQRLLAEAARPAGPELTYEQALAGIATTQDKITTITAKIDAQERSIARQTETIARLQAANDALNASMAQYQVQLQAAQANQALVNQGLELAFQWFLRDRDAMIAMGDEGVAQALVVDESARALMTGIDQFAGDTSTTAQTTLAGLITSFQRSSASAVIAVNKELDKIKKVITTIHRIVTVYETAGSPPGMAVGGLVQQAMPYIVGERGPELFVPQAAGQIVPNAQMAGQMALDLIGHGRGGNGQAAPRLYSQPASTTNIRNSYLTINSTAPVEPILADLRMAEWRIPA